MPTIPCVTFDFSSSDPENALATATASTSKERVSVEAFIARIFQQRLVPNLLTIQGVVLTPDFLLKWRTATKGLKVCAVHATFESCHFDEAFTQDMCDFAFSYLRASSLKLECDFDAAFIGTMLRDARIRRLQNLRLCPLQLIQLEDSVLLDLIFQPGAIEIFEIRRVQLSETFINQLIQRFRNSTRVTKSIGRIFLSGKIPWPLYHINFRKNQVQSRSPHDQFRFKNRFGYYTLDIMYSISEVEIRVVDDDKALRYS